MKKITARSKRCVICKNRADIFWPINIEGIESLPHCNDCQKEEKIKLIKALDEVLNENFEDDE
jgi:hypothetical protein